MATIRDVALRAGVSVATVSYVLNGKKQVSDGVTARVVAAASELNYRPSRSARALRKGHSNTVGLVLPDITNPFFPTLAQAVEHNARKRGFGVVFVDAQGSLEAEREGLELLSEYGVAGAIWCPVGDAVPPAPLAFPVVLLDRPVAGFDAVYSDFVAGGRLAAACALRLGHERIGLLSGPRTLASARLRRQGFLAGLAAQGRLEPVWEHVVPFSSDLPAAASDALLKRDITLLVAANDAVAIGVLKRAREAGIAVPSELSVIGFDDISWAELVFPALSTVRQPLAKLGESAVSLLQRRLDAPNGDPQAVVLGVEFVERGSTAPLPRNT